MIRLKYARKGNSGTIEGCTGYNYQYTAAAGESGVKRVLLTAAQAANLFVGSSVIIGDKGTGTSADRGVASMYKAGEKQTHCQYHGCHHRRHSLQGVQHRDGHRL